MLAVLLCLGFGLYREQWAWGKAALVLGVLLLLAPRAYFPLAVAWFALGRGLGWVTTHLLLIALFGGLVIPVAMLRKWFGKDTMRLKSFGRGADSVFVARSHRYTATDLHHPF